MPDPRIVVTGVKPVRQAIRQARDVELRKALKDAGKEGAEQVGLSARSTVPVVSAQLQGTIRASGTMAGGVVRAGSSRVRWAGPIHFGWAARNIRPNPFLYRAADQRATQVTDIYYRRVAAIAASIAARGNINV